MQREEPEMRHSRDSFICRYPGCVPGADVFGVGNRFPARGCGHRRQPGVADCPSLLLCRRRRCDSLCNRLPCEKERRLTAHKNNFAAMRDYPMRVWRNWQTRKIQVLMGATS